MIGGCQEVVQGDVGASGRRLCLRTSTTHGKLRRHFSGEPTAVRAPTAKGEGGRMATRKGSELTDASWAFEPLFDGLRQGRELLLLTRLSMRGVYLLQERYAACGS